MDERRYREVEERLWESLDVKPIESMIDTASIGRLRMQELGDGPPILMIHGGAVSGASWAPLAAALPGFRCLMLDRPGCGLSEPAQQDLTAIADYTAFVGKVIPEVLDGVGLDTAHVLANSLGGFFGFHGAAAAPERVDRLIGIGSIVGTAMDHIPLIMRIGQIGPMPKLMAKMPPNRKAVRAMLKQIGLKDALQAGRVSPVFEEWFLANMKHTDSMINDTNVPRLFNMKGVIAEAVFTQETLDRITMPTKLIWGENDPMAGPAVARSFADQLPDGQLDLWPNTGHAPWIDNASRAASSIEEFLNS